jgi:N-acetylneuraminic acid mutarotase
MNTFDIRIRNAAIVTLVCAFAAAQAWAASANPDFKAYDKNSDGMVSLEEFVELGGKGQDFLAGDADGNNRLSSDEWAKVAASTAPGKAPSKAQ